MTLSSPQQRVQQNHSVTCSRASNQNVTVRSSNTQIQRLSKKTKVLQSETTKLELTDDTNLFALGIRHSKPTVGVSRTVHCDLFAAFVEKILISNKSKHRFGIL